ncbi:nucleotidyltransferase domain-containing protein [Desulfovirgula thermocuniculi]|uniref:nucleotidyltransferase domain-containing protein n=1 Tax=Desulfovirgula thermocuniculi TaxID=348842 RepID=UPI000417935C|nr:nucleotidyltransferase domain-containing protein [Desulfovirgula thermocuniculi]
MERKGIYFPKNDKEKIIAQLKKYLVSRPEIRFAFLHGSFLEDDLPCRDIDLAVYFDEKISDDQTFDLTLETAAELSRLLGIPVDVHPLNIVLAILFVITPPGGFCWPPAGGKVGKAKVLVGEGLHDVPDGFRSRP